MPGRRLSCVGVVVLLVAIFGCGKKTVKETSSDSQPPPPLGGLPGVNLPNKKDNRDKKEPQSTDFDILVSDMKMHAGKLKTDTQSGGYETLKRLTDNIKSDHPRRAEVYAALVETAGKLPAADRSSYVYWATLYAGKENAVDLIDTARLYAADVKTSATSSAAFDRLAELKEPSTFPHIAAMLNDKSGILRLQSASALKKIGPPAEKAVQAYAGPTGPDGKANEFILRTVAIGILGEIGTADSLPLLQSLAGDTNSTISAGARTAADAIRARAK